MSLYFKLQHRMLLFDLSSVGVSVETQIQPVFFFFNQKFTKTNPRLKSLDKNLRSEPWRNFRTCWTTSWRILYFMLFKCWTCFLFVLFFYLFISWYLVILNDQYNFVIMQYTFPVAHYIYKFRVYLFKTNKLTLRRLIF